MSILFDLVGYVGAVIFVTVAMLYGVGVTSVALFDLWIKRITEGDKRNFISSKIPDWLFEYNESYWLTTNISLALLFFYTLVIYTEAATADMTWLQGLQDLSIKLTPFFSYVVSLIVPLVIINWLAKKGYKLSKAVKNLEEKSKY